MFMITFKRIRCFNWYTLKKHLYCCLFIEHIKQVYLHVLQTPIDSWWGIHMGCRWRGWCQQLLLFFCHVFVNLVTDWSIGRCMICDWFMVTGRHTRLVDYRWLMFSGFRRLVVCLQSKAFVLLTLGCLVVGCNECARLLVVFAFSSVRYPFLASFVLCRRRITELKQ